MARSATTNSASVLIFAFEIHANLFHRLKMPFWRPKKSTENEVGQLPPPDVFEESGDEPFQAAKVLEELGETRDLAAILKVLDVHLDEIQQDGYGEYARELVLWADAQFKEQNYPSSYRALLAGVYHRLEGTDPAKNLLRAVELYREALEQCQEAGEEEGVAVILNNLGNTYLELGAIKPAYFRQAIPVLEEAVEFFRDVGEASHRAFISMSLGEAYAGLQEEGPDHFEIARENYERAWALFERGQSWLELGHAQGRLGDVQFELGAFYGPGTLEKAVRHYRNALTVFGEQNQPDLCGLYQSRLAEAYINLSNMESEHLQKGLRAYERALDMFKKSDDEVALADTCMEMGRLHQVLKDEDQNMHLEKAVERYVQALQIYRELGLLRQQGEALQGLARVYLEAGGNSATEDITQAIQLLEEAAQIYQRENCIVEFQTIESELQQARQMLEISPAG